MGVVSAAAPLHMSGHVFLDPSPHCKLQFNCAVKFVTAFSRCDDVGLRPEMQTNRCLQAFTSWCRNVGDFYFSCRVTNMMNVRLSHCNMNRNRNSDKPSEQHESFNKIPSLRNKSSWWTGRLLRCLNGKRLPLRDLVLSTQRWAEKNYIIIMPTESGQTMQFYPPQQYWSITVEAPKPCIENVREFFLFLPDSYESWLDLSLVFPRPVNSCSLRPNFLKCEELLSRRQKKRTRGKVRQTRQDFRQTTRA